MKKTILRTLGLLILLTCSGKLLSQVSHPFIAYDRFGNSYDLEELNITSGRSIGGANTTMSISTSCTSGYFTAYFESGSVWDTNPATQTVLCQVLTDISNFIDSPLSTNPGIGPKINLFCSNTPSTSPATLGTATSFFVVPQNVISPQGIADNQIYKMLISGVDSYSNTPSSFLNGNGFYHGYIRLNPSPPSGTWNTNLAGVTVGSSEFDLYTVLLHEITHSLGFASLIGANGNSIIGYGNNSYSRFDQFLYSSAGVPLISSTTASSCPTSNMVFTSSLTSVIAASTTTCIADYTDCSAAVHYSSSTVDVSVYTPNCFETGSSLSHFEDMCAIPSNPTLSCATGTTAAANNNLYYTMSNGSGQGNCYVKRYLKDEERYVLCDLGYSVSSTYGSTVAASNHTYAGSCSGPNIWGLNDGISNGSYIYTAALSSTNQISVPVSTVLANDSPLTVTLSCLEVVNTTSVTAAIVGTSIVITNTNNAAGLVILKYLPKNASGNFGGATYIFAYFLSANCPSVNSCVLVQNSGFENSGSLCGNMGATPVSVNCWENLANYPYYFKRLCSSAGNIFNAGVSTLGQTPPFDSYSGSPNNAFIGLKNFVNNTGYNYIPDVVGTTLSSALVPSQDYEVSLWIYNPANAIPSVSNAVSPVIITVETMPNIAFGGVGSLLTNFTVNPTGIWTHVSNTVTFSPTSGHSAVKMYIHPATAQYLNSSTGYQYFALIDDLTITSLPSASFSIPQSTICGPVSYTNLGQYASVTGTFTGAGITYTNSQYNFDPPSGGSGNYPIAFTYTSGSCTNTLWDQITVSSCCFNSLTPVFSQTSVPSGTVIFGSSGSLRLTNSFTVEPGVHCYLYPGEFIMGNGVSITVANTATLTINDAHLYTCGNYLWKGIIVQDGGFVETGSSLIEDAETAVDITNNTSGALTKILNSNLTVFNKNFTDINLQNFPGDLSGTYDRVLDIQQSVFTCRDFTFTTSSWPSAGSSDLRAASNSTTGVAAPYTFQSAPVASVKNQPVPRSSYAAIQLFNVGITSNTFAPGIDMSSVLSNSFLLFDAHATFIKGINSNATINNCVFQNTRSYFNGTTTVAEAAIQFSNTPGLETRLDLTATVTALSNRFWNCHTGVLGTNIYRFNIENGIFRSTQQLGDGPGLPGEKGIDLSTNRFQYFMRYNEFTNINTCINVPLLPAPTCTSCASGIYAANIAVLQNTFSPGSSSFAYVDHAVNISCPSAVPFTVAPSVSNPGSVGVRIEHNIFNGVFNGASVHDMMGFSTGVNENTLTIAPYGSAASQFGIDLSNCIGTGTLAGQASIYGNVAAGTGTANATNSLCALVYGSGNLGYASPSITCNQVNDGYNGFMFSGQNTPTFSLPGTRWVANTMENLVNGMVLTNTAIIGQQGYSLTGTGNQWLGSWTGSNRGLNSINASTASLSPLYYAITSPSDPYMPVNYASLPNNLSYNAPGALVQTSMYNYASCTDPSALAVPVTGTINYGSAEQTFIANSNAYRFLRYTSGLRSSGSLKDFYDAVNGTDNNIKLLALAEEDLYAGNYSTARSILSSITATNNVEANYKEFYRLYANFQASGSLSADDAADLSTLANICPSAGGNCIYQARALYNALFRKVVIYNDDCNYSSGARLGHFVNPAPDSAATSVWDVKLYPNPAASQLSITTDKESEVILVSIADLAGRTALKQAVKTSNFIAILELGLPNGAYVITFTNLKDQILNKKLLIAK